MQNPLIGVTTYTQENKYGYPITAVMKKYITAVKEAGGIPVLLPNGLSPKEVETLIEKIDGILFTGGGDLDPSTYRATSHPSLTGVDEERDISEFELVRGAVSEGKPFLGICRGLQTVNVALGGTLYSHLPDQFPGAIKHDYDSGTEREYLAHEIGIIPGTRLAEVFQADRLVVNSLHHQGVQYLAPNLVCAATAPDGLIEALELPDHPFGVAVQWHPEWLTTQPPMQRLFQSLIQAAK